MLVTVTLHASLSRTGPSPATLELPDGADVSRALEALSLSAEAVVMLLNSGPAGVSTPLAEGDRLELVPVVEGG